MFILSNFITATASILNMLLSLLWWLILFRVLISWVNADLYNPIVQFLYRVTEPILDPLRRILPVTGIDISPILAAFVIYFLQAFLVSSLYELAARLR